MNKAFDKNQEVEKIKVTSAEIVVHGTCEKPYYEIKYYDISDGNYHVGYSSYDLSIVFGYLKDCFEIVQEVKEESNNGWIPCSERLPDEHETMFAKLKGTDKWDSAMPEKISDDVNVTVEFEDGTRKTKTMHTIDGEWKTDINILKFKVIAWQPVPEQYQPK